MATDNKRNYVLDTAQLIVWVCVFLVPALINFGMTGNLPGAMGLLKGSLRSLLPIFAIYCLNYYLLVPRCLFGGNRKWFWIANAVLLLAWNLYKFIPRGQIPQEVLDAFGPKNVWAFWIVGVTASLFMESLVILLAVGLRYLMRMNDREKEIQEDLAQAPAQSAFPF